MRRILLITTLALLSTPAWAAGWQAEMVDDEGGASMQAWVDSGDAETPADLRLMCAGEEGVNLRYAFGSDLADGTELPTDGPLNFDMYVDDAYVVVPMQFEEMDGAYAAYMKPGAPLIGLLKSGKAIKIADATGKYHDVTFSLAGSTRAVDKVLASCQ